MSNGDPQAAADKEPGDGGARRDKSPVEKSDTSPEALEDAPALEEEDDSPVDPENS